MTRLSDDDFLADQYLLGLLDPGELSATEQRIERDGAFADIVAAGSHRFGPLDDTAVPIPFPGDAWTRLKERLKPPVMASP